MKDIKSLKDECYKKAHEYVKLKKKAERAKKALDIVVKEVEELENELGYNAPELYPDKFTAPKEEDKGFYLEYDDSDPTCNLPVPEEDAGERYNSYPNRKAL